MLSNTLSTYERSAAFVAAVEAAKLRDAPNAVRDARAIQNLKLFFELEPVEYHEALGLALEIQGLNGGREFETTIKQVSTNLDVSEEASVRALRLLGAKQRPFEPDVWSNGSSTPLFKKQAA